MDWLTSRVFGVAMYSPFLFDSGLRASRLFFSTRFATTCLMPLLPFLRLVSSS